MLAVLDEPAAQADLAAGRLGCPVCPGRLRPWAHGRERMILGRGGRRMRLRPRRARCGSCRRTQILLPAWCAPRRAYGIEVIAAALAARVAGAGHRGVAAQVGVPAGTVRDWLRRISARAEALRGAATQRCYELAPEFVPLQSAGSPLADALDALAAAAASAQRRLGYPRHMLFGLLGQLGLAHHLTPARGG